MTLHIKMNSPGKELNDSPIENAIIKLAAQITIEKHQNNLPEAPELELTFMLPGKQVRAPFTGMRMGGYTPSGNTLYFETSVPEHITHSEKAELYVAMVLQDIIDNAEWFFTDVKVKFDAIHWRMALQKFIPTE